MKEAGSVTICECDATKDCLFSSSHCNTFCSFISVDTPVNVYLKLPVTEISKIDDQRSVSENYIILHVIYRTSGQTETVSVRFRPKYVSVSVFRLSSFSAFGQNTFFGQNSLFRPK